MCSNEDVSQEVWLSVWWSGMSPDSYFSTRTNNCLTLACLLIYISWPCGTYRRLEEWLCTTGCPFVHTRILFHTQGHEWTWCIHYLFMNTYYKLRSSDSRTSCQKLGEYYRTKKGKVIMHILEKSDQKWFLCVWVREMDIRNV